MGQANKICPVCERIPGNPHKDDCARSKESIKNLGARAAIAARPRKVYPGKNDAIATFEDAEGKRHFLRNRGLPYVNVPKNGKHQFSGGLPRGDDGMPMSPKDLIEEVEFFNAGMASQKARLEAAEAASAKQPSSDPELGEYDPELLEEASVLNLPPHILTAARSTAIHRKETFRLVREEGVFTFDPEGNVVKTKVHTAE